MDSYNFHFERMNNLDLHPLGLPVSRLSPAKSGGSIDQFTHHHHHGKGDSAYSSFSGGSNAPDYPSPFLPEDLQGSTLHYTDLKYVKAIYHPSQLLQSDARSMDQLYRSVEAISKQYRHSNNNKENNNNSGGSSNGFLAKPYLDQEEAPPAPPPLPPPPPARLDSFIATRNLENSRAHHGPEGQRPAQLHASRAPAANPEAGCLRAHPVYAWRSSQPFHRDPLNPDRTDKATEQQKSANVLSRSPPRGTSKSENPKHKQQAAGNDGGGGHFEGHRKRAHSAHGSLIPDPARSGSPRHAAQNLINGSIQHKGQFYFVTGVCKPPESGPKNVSPCVSEAESETSTVVETHRLVEREKERGKERDHLFRKTPHQRHQGSLDTAADEREYLTKTLSQEEKSHGHAITHAANPRVSRSFDALEQSHKSTSRDIGWHHSSIHPIFYCGPGENSSPPLCTPTHPSPNTETAPPPAVEQASQHKREDQGRRGRRQLLGDVASEKINKETTPLLYHLTGASRAAPKPKRDVDVSVNGKETSQGSAHKDVQASPSCDNRPSYSDAPEEETGSHPCNALDDSFKKYYKEKLKDAQSKVLRETSFKRRDLQLSWPHRIRPRPEPRPTVLPSVCSSQDSEASSADTLAPALSSSEGAERASVKGEEAKGEERESAKGSEMNGRPANVAQPQVARVGGRKRLTPEQKKLCYSEPEKLNQLGDGPSHSSCRSLGSEREVRLPGEEELGERGEEGLVAARRKVFETRGRTQSASSLSKNNLKHLQQKALVAYMERKTGQKVAEPQQPAPQVPPSQRYSAADKLSDWGPRPQASGPKGPKKKLHRPHSAGRILDSSSSSIRYAQFSSAQSSWRDTPSPSQGKSASVESLLDQPEPPEFFRTRSISTPHAFQVHNYVNDPSPVDTTETSSLQKMADEEALPRPDQAPSNPPEGQRVRVVAQRGKSMEELGVSKDAMPLVLSKSSEQLDQFRSRQGGPGRDKRNVSFFREGQEGRAQVQESIRQGREDAQAEKTHLSKQNSAPQLGSEEDAAPVTRGPADSSRSTSPAFSCSSWARAHSGSPGTHGSGPPVSDELGTGGPPSEPSIPPSPGDQETSEKEIKSTSSSPVSSQQPKVPPESKSSYRLMTTTPVTSEEREYSVDEPSETVPSETDQEVVSLSCGVTTDPSLWIFLPEPGSSSTEEDEAPPQSGGTVFEGQSPLPAPTPQGSEPPTSADAPTPADADTCQGAEGQGEVAGEGEGEGPAEDEANAGEGEGPGGQTQKPEKTPPPDEPRWAELVEEVVSADQSLASILYPLTNRKTALMLMEQLLSEDTLLMEEHYKKKQEQREAADSSETGDDVEPPPHFSSSSPDSENPQPPEPPNTADITEKKRVLVSRIRERLRALEESQGALQTEVGENRARGRAVEALVQEHCQPMELERYTLFIGDLERVVSLLLCLSARLARVQNALSTVNQHTDAEDKQSLDNRHRLLCKQRDDAKDLKDNLDRRERLVSTFLSRQLSSEQLHDYRRFVQTKASLLIRLKDLEEKQRLGEEQLEALLNSLPL